MSEKTYEATGFCDNCGYEGPVTAPVGQALYTRPCPLCACKMIMPVARRDYGREMKGLDVDQ